MNDLPTVTQLICGQTGTRTKSPLSPNPISCCPTGHFLEESRLQTYIKKLIKHLVSLWTILRGFFSNFHFPFFLILLGTWGSYSQQSWGYIYWYIPCSWNSWIHHLTRGGGFANESEDCKSPHVAFQLPLLPCCHRCEQTLWGNVGMTERKRQRLWPMVLKTLESLLILLILNN